jgi:UDP-N-acetylglucosamine transferase subunit ALG13
VTAGRLRLFVTVGTDHHPFDRLIDLVDSWCMQRPEVEVLVQHGASKAPVIAKGLPYLAHEDQASAMAAASIIVCHGGPATIADVRRSGRRPIVMPRNPEYGEHVDGHQIQYARYAAQEGLATLAEDEASLIAALDAALADPGSLLIEDDDEDRDGAATRTTMLLRRLAGERVPVLYIAGLGRSGSTLLDRILGQIPDVCSVGELVFIWERGLVRNERCGCGERFLACPFWREVGRIAFDGWAKVDAGRAIELRHTVDRNRYLPFLVAGPLAPPAFRAARREYFDRYLDPLYRAIQTTSRCLLVVDSSKHTSYAYLLRQLWSVDLHVVQMVRRGEGVAYSWRKEVARPEVDGAETMPQYSAMKSATLWTTHNALLQGLPAIGVPSMVLRYEDLIADPVGAVSRVLGLAGLLPEERELAFLTADGAELGPNHTVAGNPLRFVTGHVAIKADEAWRHSLPERDRRVVSALTRPLRGRFGY